jgi:hypothetical protein
VLPIPGNPQATIARMQLVQRAVYGLSNPSATDLATLARVAQYIAEARAALRAAQNQAATEAATAVNTQTQNAIAQYATVMTGVTPQDLAGNQLQANA